VSAVEGRVVPFGVWQEIDNPREGNFLERFAPGSLARSFASGALSKLQGYFEHGRDTRFGGMPVMVVERTWEQQDGGYFSGELLDGLPEVFYSGLRRRLYGTSLGARVVDEERVRFPQRSTHNPKAIEEGTYTEVDAFDISITPRPQYEGTTVALRSLPEEEGAIYRVSFSPVVLGGRARRDYLTEPEWRIRDCLAEPPDYFAGLEPVDSLDLL
jgi:phage head maturation protease